MARITLAVAFIMSAPCTFAGTTLDFWHSYIHAQTHEMHYGFHLAQYKRGVFWGSCGPSTKSLQWSFMFDLAGEGPVYSAQQLAVLDDNGKALRVISGQVVKDQERGRAKIEIEVESGGATNKFIGNGEYRIKKPK